MIKKQMQDVSVMIYVVQPGDTLFTIAESAGTSVAALQQLNQFPYPDRLVPGQAILIPEAAPEPLQYTVTSGDTLYEIAQLYNTTIRALREANPLAELDPLLVGTVLIIPGWSQESYTVQPGDSLYRIADRYGVSPELIAQTNHLPPDGSIFPGQILIIPFQPRRDIETLAYFQLLDPNGLERGLREMGQYITYGALFEYPVTPEGLLVISPNTERAVALLTQSNIRPLATITNWTPEIGFDSDLARTILGNEAIKTQSIASILGLLDQYGFAGVNIDFENMYPEDRYLFNSFIEDLAAALRPAGYLTTVAVAPKTGDLPNAPWIGAFDYAALGTAADIIFIMTYEWGWVGGPPMAIAPLPQVSQVLRYAVTQIPPVKIIQGVPLYAYDWPLPDTEATRATAVNLVEVYNLAYRFGATINFDPVAQSPWFRYTNDQGVDHEVWLEDARSVQAKYELAQSLGLRGVGYWAYGNHPYGFPQNWPILTQRFNVVQI